MSRRTRLILVSVVQDVRKDRDHGEEERKEHERLVGPFQGAAAIEGCVPAASAAVVVLGGEDEGREPAVVVVSGWYGETMVLGTAYR